MPEHDALQHFFFTCAASFGVFVTLVLLPIGNAFTITQNKLYES
jgi:hypothetical protein